jgi:hypothetical protein
MIILDIMARYNPLERISLLTWEALPSIGAWFYSLALNAKVEFTVAT